jgi:hypothetical protein
MPALRREAPRPRPPLFDAMGFALADPLADLRRT